MSHDQLHPTHDQTNSEGLTIYLLNGHEVPLTPDQAKALGAQPIGHGGHLGLEYPADGATPISREIPADDIPQTMKFSRGEKKQARRLQEKKKWHQRTSVRIGGVAAGLIAATTTAVTIGGGGDSDKSQIPAASATPNQEASTANDPWAWEEDPTTAPSNEVTPVATPDTITLEYLQTIDSQDIPQAVYDYSMQPVDTESHTPKQAVERLLQDWKVYWLGGDTSQSSDISQKESPESLARGEKQLATLFGPEEFRNEENLLWDWMTGTREYLTLNMEYLTTENGYSENATLNDNFKILSEKVQSDGTVEYLVENSWSSNMNELDPSVASKDIDMPNFTTNRFVTISEYEGNYYITQIRSEAAG